MGPLALAGAGIVTGCSRLAASRRLSTLPSTSRHRAVITTPLVGISGVLLLSLVFLTWRQTAVYHNLVTLYTGTLTKNPGCWMAYYNLGIALNDHGDTDGAIAKYREAIELRPSYAEAHYNLGRLLVQKGQLDDAIAHYEKALEINPADAEAHNNRGAALFANGRVDEAIAHYPKRWQSSRITPMLPAICADAPLSNGNLDGAIAYYSAASRYRQIRLRLSTTLRALCFERVGKMRRSFIIKKSSSCPENADARANWEARSSQKAASGRNCAMRDALRIMPDNVAAREQSGVAAGDSRRPIAQKWIRGCFAGLNEQNPKALGAKIMRLFSHPCCGIR